MIPFTRLHTTQRQNLAEVLPLKKPFTVLIEPSSLCNFKCTQCFQSIQSDNYFTQNRMNMPLVRFQKVIAQLKAWKGAPLKVLKLSLYGEPLVSPDFCEMLRVAREANVAERIETTTNASLLSREIAEKLVQYQLDYLRVSIYATEQEKHESVTGSMVNIRNLHENLRVLQEVKAAKGSERPFISAKMLDSYGAENEQFKRLYQDVSDEVYLDKPHNWITVDGVDFIKNYYKDRIGEAREDFKRNSQPRIACPMAFTTMAVRSNGDVAPCCVDFIGGTNLGNVEESSLQALWNSGAWLEFQKMQLQNRKHENSSCAHCDFSACSHYAKDNIDGFDAQKLL